MRHACPRCDTPLPRTRKPTSTRQLLWGGWTCTGCGAELNSRRQVIGGQVVSAAGIQIALQPANQQRSRRLVTLGGIVAPGLSLVGLVGSWVVGPWLLLPTFAVMVVLMIAGMVGLFGLMKKDEVILTDAAIRWEGGAIRPDAIDEVWQERKAVCIEADGQTHRLVPLGSPKALLEALEEVRRVGRVTGTTRDVPDHLRHLRSEQRDPG